MQAAVREDAAFQMFGTHVRVELPPQLVAPARAALGPLSDPQEPPRGVVECAGSAVRISPAASGWLIESGSRRWVAANAEEAVLQLQEQLLEAGAAQSGRQLLFRGSVVTRGSQCLLIVGDRGDTHSVLAMALTSLDFEIVSIGAAAFDIRSLTPLPLALTFRLDSAARDVLQAAGISLEVSLRPVSGELYRARSVVPAPEPTHALFPEALAGGLSVVRPISATAARARLCSALIAGPEGPSPFAAVAELIRHARGIHLTLGDLPRAVGQLSRLLPRWQPD
jgi:hypothetical protein